MVLIIFFFPIHFSLFHFEIISTAVFKFTNYFLAIVNHLLIPSGLFFISDIVVFISRRLVYIFKKISSVYLVNMFNISCNFLSI